MVVRCLNPDEKHEKILTMSGGAPSPAVSVAATCFVCDDDFQTQREYNKHMFDVHHIYVVDNEPEEGSRGKHVPLEVEPISDDEIEIIEPAGKEGDGNDIAAPSTTHQSNSADGPEPEVIDLISDSDSESDDGWIEDDDSPDDAANKSESRESDPDQVGTCRTSETTYHMLEECLRIAAEKRLRTRNVTNKTASADVGTSSEHCITPRRDRNLSDKTASADVGTSSEPSITSRRDGQEVEKNAQRSSSKTPPSTTTQIGRIEESFKKSILSGYNYLKQIKGITSPDMESSSGDKEVLAVVSANVAKEVAARSDVNPAQLHPRPESDSMQDIVRRAVANGQRTLNTIQNTGLSGASLGNQARQQSLPPGADNLGGERGTEERRIKEKHGHKSLEEFERRNSDSMLDIVRRAVAKGQPTLNTIQNTGLSGASPGNQARQQSLPPGADNLGGERGTEERRIKEKHGHKSLEEFERRNSDSMLDIVRRAVAKGQPTLNTIQNTGLSGASLGNQARQQSLPPGADNLGGEWGTEERRIKEKYKHLSPEEVARKLAKKERKRHKKEIKKLKRATVRQLASVAEHELADAPEDIQKGVKRVVENIYDKIFNMMLNGGTEMEASSAPTGVPEVNSTKQDSVRSSNTDSNLMQLLQTIIVDQLKPQAAPVNEGASSNQCLSPPNDDITADTTRVSSTVDTFSLVSHARLDSIMETRRLGQREKIPSSANGNTTGSAKPGNDKSKPALTGLLTGALVGPEEVPYFTCDICSLHFFNHAGLKEHNQEVHSSGSAEAVSLFADEEPATGLTMWDLCTSDNNVQDVMTSIGTVVDVTEKYSSGGSTEISTDEPYWPEDNTAASNSCNADLLRTEQFEIPPSLRKRTLSGNPKGSGSGPRSSLEGNRVAPDEDGSNNDDPSPYTKRRRRDSSDSGISLGPTMSGANQTASSRGATPVLPAHSPIEGTRGRGIPQEGHVDTTRDKENLNEGDANYGLIIAEVKSLSRETQLKASPADIPHNALDQTSTNECEEQLFCTGTCNEPICSISIEEKATLVARVLVYFIKMCRREIDSSYIFTIANCLHARFSWLVVKYTQLRQITSLKGGIERVHSCSLCGARNFLDLRSATAHLFSKGHVDKVVSFYWTSRVTSSRRNESQGTRGEGNSTAVNTMESDNPPAGTDTVKETGMSTASGTSASTSVDSSRFVPGNMDTRSEGHHYGNGVYWPNTTAFQGVPAGSTSHDPSVSISQKQFSQQTNNEAIQRATHPPTSASSGNAQSYLPSELVPAGPQSCPGRIQHPEASQRVHSISEAYPASGSYPSYNKPGDTVTLQRHPSVTTGTQMIALQRIPERHELSRFQQYRAGQKSSVDMKHSHMNTASGMPHGHSETRGQPGHELSGFQQYPAGQANSGGMTSSHTNMTSGMAQGYPGTRGIPGHEPASGQASSGGTTSSHVNAAIGMPTNIWHRQYFTNLQGYMGPT